MACEQLPISLLAAIARREGHTVGLAFTPSLFDDKYFLEMPRLARLFDDRSAVLDAIRVQRPDVLAFSALTNTYQWMLGIARDAKEMLPDVRVVFGGVHASAVPDNVLARPEVDYVCIGEGDVAFPTLLRGLEEADGLSGPVSNLAYKRADGETVRGPQDGFIQDLDSLPAFDKRIWEDHIRIRDDYMTMAGRGCPYRCTFCFNSFYARLQGGTRGKYVRMRSVDHLMAELVHAKRRYDPRYFEFLDDVFTVDKAWLQALLARYKREIGRPFACLTHPRYVDDEVARWLKEAGCVSAQMGVQSLDDTFKRKQLKRFETATHVSEAVDALNRHGISIKADHIFGLPGEEPAAQEAARLHYAEHTPARIDTFWATYFPGTDMVQQGLALGLIDETDVAAINEGELRSYHDGGNVPTEHHRTLRAYEVLFRAMPLLPRRVRGDARLLALLERLPDRASHLSGLFVDGLNGLRAGSNDHFAYGAHYLYWMARISAKRAGISPPPATRPADVDPPPPPPPSEETAVRNVRLPLAAT
jgi:radical SAM superfamily enzyme YgiQ (UPF0313 family)